MTTLYLDQKDIELQTEGKVLVIRENGKRTSSIPLSMLDRVVIMANTRLESRVINTLAQTGTGTMAMRSSCGSFSRPAGHFFPASLSTRTNQHSFFILNAMNSHTSLYLISYDIASPKRLRKALFEIRHYATGGQKSVFECFLTARELQRLRRNCEQLIDPQEDRIAIVPITDASTVKTLGKGVRPEDPDYYYVG